MNKYGAVRTEYGGEWYASRGEAEHARRLDQRRAAGAIRDWRRGRAWELVPPPNRVTLTPDYEVTRPDGSVYVLDFKGRPTELFKVKLKLWKWRHPDVPFYLVRADGVEVPA